MTKILLMLAVSGGHALSQPEATPAADPTPQVVPASGVEPDLDVLLGLKRPGDSAAPVEAPTDITRTELDRRLGNDEVSDEFAIAVERIEESAKRLSRARDAGADTQRLQSEALRRLDKLIDDAQKNSGKKKKKKSKPQEAQGQQEPQEGQQQSSQSRPGETSQDGTPEVGMQQGSLRPPRASESATWGDLPEHVRQALTQGRSDRFSSLYQQLTEEYYRRLAEERRPMGGEGPR